MTRGPDIDRIRILMGFAVLFAVASVVVDFTLVRPGIASFGDLNIQRKRLMKQADTLLDRQQESRDLARQLKLESIAELGTSEPEDPVSYLGSCLDRARLSRLEMRITGFDHAGKLKQTRMSVLTRGRYRDIVSFVKILETGSRVVVIDKLNIAQPSSTQALEARFNLTIFDPREGG